MPVNKKKGDLGKATTTPPKQGVIESCNDWTSCARLKKMPALTQPVAITSMEERRR